MLQKKRKGVVQQTAWGGGEDFSQIKRMGKKSTALRGREKGGSKKKKKKKEKKKRKKKKKKKKEKKKREKEGGVLATRWGKGAWILHVVEKKTMSVHSTEKETTGEPRKKKKDRANAFKKEDASARGTDFCSNSFGKKKSQERPERKDALKDLSEGRRLEGSSTTGKSCVIVQSRQKKGGSMRGMARNGDLQRKGGGTPRC